MSPRPRKTKKPKREEPVTYADFDEVDRSEWEPPGPQPPAASPRRMEAAFDTWHQSFTDEAWEDVNVRQAFEAGLAVARAREKAQGEALAEVLPALVALKDSRGEPYDDSQRAALRYLDRLIATVRASLGESEPLRRGL